jgi:3-oxoadipate enol-lactonase
MSETEVAADTGAPARPLPLRRLTREVPISRRMVVSQDGTRISCWTNDGSGVPILLSNGLGTPVKAWPDVINDKSRYRVVSWDHRGLGASERPADETRISVKDHADDLVATMDAFGMDRAIVIGWSLGVNVAFEVAQRDPHRVAGVLAVAGVPGGSFSALFHPLPRVLRPRAGRVGAHLLRYVGPVLSTLSDGMPASEGGHFDPRALSTFGLDAMHLTTLIHVLRVFAKHDWAWYSRLAKATGDHEPMDLDFFSAPVTFIAGKWDSISSAKEVEAASDRVRGSRYVELAGTHYIPLQFPSVMKAELDRLIDRSGALA